MIRLRIQIEPNKPVLEEGYTLFPGWYHPFSRMATPSRGRKIGFHGRFFLLKKEMAKQP